MPRASWKVSDDDLMMAVEALPQKMPEARIPPFDMEEC